MKTSAEFRHFSSQIYPLKMTSFHKSDVKNWHDNFHVDFKNLIGFAVALWESAKPTP